MVCVMNMEIEEFVIIGVADENGRPGGIANFKITEPKLVPPITESDAISTALTTRLIQSVKDEPINYDPRQVIVKTQDIRAGLGGCVIGRNDDFLFVIGRNGGRRLPGSSPTRDC